MRRHYIGLFIIFISGLVGCTAAPDEVSRIQAVELAAPDSDLQSTNYQALLALHQEWRGVPYRLGGSSKKGIDCSALVALAFRDILGRQLPRTVAGQHDLGVQVPRSELQSGDLLFFKTGRSTRHVGIYLEKDRFLHASTSRGVTISSLLNPYWAAKYWMAKRLQ